MKDLKEIFTEEFKGEVKFMESMIQHTSLKIGGPADIFLTPRDIHSLANTLTELRRNRVSVSPLGGGTNILVRDGGIDGAVVSMRSFRRIGIVSRNSASVQVKVEAGTVLQRFVHYASENGYSGLEGFAGIPGTVGGALSGNTGAFGYEIKDLLLSVEIIDEKGKVRRVKAEEIPFTYRTSGIPPEVFILNAEMKLGRDDPKKISVRVQEYLKIKKERQPLWEASAGCVFKNPPGMASGRLIEEAGCKGMRIGDIEVSTLHANFFINKGSARASDFIMLMAEVAGRVKEKCGVMLEPEIKIIGRDSVNG